MQLIKPNIREALAFATCALIHGPAQAAEGDWKLSGAILYYSEVDRVTVHAPVLSATQELGDEENVTVRTVYDSLSGASPNGATPTNTAQTFTGASGKSAYTTPAGEMPLKKFEDTRVALGLDWAKRISPLSSRLLTANFSKEEDYLSTGGSGTWTYDLHDKLTTFATGLGVSYDTIEANGGAPAGLQSTSAVVQTTTCASGIARIQPRDDNDDDDGEDEGDDGCGEDDGEHKSTVDLLLGVTQVVSRRTLMQLNYTWSRSSGYLTDPYKIISIVDPVTGATLDYVYEKRPASRMANIFYWKVVHHFERDVVHLSYRYYSDDWGVAAHSTEIAYRFRLGDSFFVEPQLRYHVQSAAEFYHHSLPGNAEVDHASADLRLGAMVSTTAGLKIGAKLGSGDLSFRVAKMTQKGESHPSDAIGIQKQFDLYPALEATIVNLGFSLPL